uniref:Uncharacterized protein n=1 Tax=viral metagenome TaxID=1070528 RepID=A0A6C0EB36_9ZZZZ
MNIILLNNHEYKFEGYWRKSKKKIKKDIKGVIRPYPVEDKPMSDKQQFLEKMKIVEENCELINYTEHKKCLLCDKIITTGYYINKLLLWENGLNHYIDIHNIKLSDEFKEFIYTFDHTKKNSRNLIKLTGKVSNKNNINYVKLHKNQLLILDALMKHGGYAKKYSDIKNNNLFRYSEHSGMIDFNNVSLDKIIVSGNTTRIDRGDEEIYLPKNIPDAINYEYLFHTHPPTPKPGARAKESILYEFPSMGDILHFIDHFNDGKTCGSLVVTSEGLYNIRKLEMNKDELIVDEDTLFHEYNAKMKEVQKKSIATYGVDFSSYKFYSEIAQDTSPIDALNKLLNNYNLHVDYYPRTRDKKGNWIIDTIFLPIYK